MFRSKGEADILLLSFFTGYSGLQVPLNDPDDPLEVFEQFVYDAMIANIVQQTNLRAQQIITIPHPPASPHTPLFALSSSRPLSQQSQLNSPSSSSTFFIPSTKLTATNTKEPILAQPGRYIYTYG